MSPFCAECSLTHAKPQCHALLNSAHQVHFIQRNSTYTHKPRARNVGAGWHRISFTCMDLSHFFSVHLCLSERHYSYLTSLLFAKVCLLIPHTDSLSALKSVQYVVFSFSCEPRKRLWENAREVPRRKSPIESICVSVCPRWASHYGWMGRMGLELSRGGAQVAHTKSHTHTMKWVGVPVPVTVWDPSTGLVQRLLHTCMHTNT